MSFLGATFLFALPLIAAPILIHLFDRRRNRPIQWGAMQFLAEATAQKTNARRMKQWLLLLLRTLAIGALIIALARPLAPGGWINSDQRQETIVVIDNSMSMSRLHEDGQLIDEAIELALEDLSNCSPNDQVRLLTSAPYPVWLSTAAMRIGEGVQGQIDSLVHTIQPTQGKSDLLAALLIAVQAEPQPTVHRRRVVVLTDGQGADWRMEDSAGWKRFRDVLTSSSVQTDLKFVSIGNKAPLRGNIAIDRLHASRTLVGVNKPLEFKADIHNYSLQNANTIDLKWKVDALEVADTLVDPVEISGVRQVPWTHSFSKPGIYRVSCRIQGDDDLVGDNHASLVVEVVDNVPVLIVENEIDLAEAQQDSFFVQAALGWIDSQPQKGSSVYSPKVVQPRRIASETLDDYHAIIVPNLKKLDSDAIERLREFVMSGGGIWIGLGPRTEIDAFNEDWFAGGSGLSALALDRIVDEENVTINPFGVEHPATSMLADNEQLDLGDVVVRRRFRFLSSESNNHSVSVLLSMSNGHPLAIEKMLGRGRVIVQAIPLRMHWSDLSRSTSFVVMIRDWIRYLAKSKATQYNLQAGDVFALQVDPDEGGVAVMNNPSGDSFELTAEVLGDRLLYRTSRTTLPGDYELELGLAGQSIPFCVHRDASESDLSPLKPVQRRELADLSGLKPAKTDTVMSGTGYTEPLWPFILIALIGLMTCELFLSGLLARERFGVSRVAESSVPFFANSSPSEAIEQISERMVVDSTKEKSAV